MENFWNIPAANFYYEMLSRLTLITARAEKIVAVIRRESDRQLEKTPDVYAQLDLLRYRQEAVKLSYPLIPFAEAIIWQRENKVLYDGIKKTHHHGEVIMIIEWLTQNIGDDPLRVPEFEVIKERMEEDIMMTSVGQRLASIYADQIWNLERQIILTTDQTLSSGLTWNITGQAPFTKADFEDLMCALWDKKFISHASGKKEVALTTLYTVFGMKPPAQPGTNRSKRKSAATTSEASFEIFDRLKAAQEQYIASGDK